MENRQIFHVEEFQIIYITFLPRGGAQLPTLQVWAVHSDFLLRVQYVKEERKSNFIVDKTGKHCLHQTI